MAVFPQTLPPNTVIGRLSVIAGPAQAIPMSSIAVAGPPGPPGAVGVPAINVKSPPYNAQGDGVTDDSAAILAAVNAAAVSGIKDVFFPAGTYIITSSAVLTPSTQHTGFNFRGQGWFSSVLQFGSLISDTWFYDNGANNRLNFATFADLGFIGGASSSFGSISAHANGFRITSAGNEQGFKFFRCRFEGLNIAFDMEGTNTASEMKFYGCKWFGVLSAAYVLNNIQSFNHEFFGCDMEVIYGDTFRIGGSGGGAIKVYGGSFIPTSDAGANTYFLNLNGAGGLGPAQSPFIFNGLRFELRGNFTNLCSIADTTQVDLAFSDCQFEDQGTGVETKTNWLVVQAYATATFSRCTFNETAGTPISVTGGGGALYGQTGTVTFDSCALPIDWSDRMHFGGGSVGAIRAINCHGLNIGAPAAGVHYAHDFDLHWRQSVPGIYTSWDSSGTLRSDGSPTDNSLRVKVAQIKLPIESWPTVQEHTLKLPAYALIKAIHLRKPPGTADATATTLRVSDNTKTTHHLTTASAAFDTAFAADVNDYYYAVGAAVNDRTLRLNSSVGTTGSMQGGIVYVEYV